MTYNLDNALHGLQEARTAIMLETGKVPEQIDALKEIEVLLNQVEVLIKDCNVLGERE